MRVPVERVPDPEVPGCGNVFVSVQVDDRVVRAALDTGAVRSSLIDLPSTARPLGRREATGMFGSEVVTEWQVGEIRIGSLRAGPLTVDRIVGGAGRHPVVGLDVLGSGPWQLDLARRELVTGEPVPAGVVFERGRNGHILTEMRWPSATATALWDTGAGISLISRPFADAHADLFELAGTTTATDISGSQGHVDLAYATAYEIDGTRFAGHTVAIVDMPEDAGPVDAVIGFPALDQARWSVDVPAGRWSIDV